MNRTARRLLVVNPNSDTRTTEMLLRAAGPAAAAANLSLRGVTVPDAPRMIVDESALRAARAATVRATVAAIDDEVADAVLIGAFGDPGVADLAAALPVPVVGIGRSAVARAAILGEPFAVATTTSALASSIGALVSSIARPGQYTGTFVTDGDPLDLASDPDRMACALEATTARAIAAGARTVVIGGGPLSDSATHLATIATARIVEPIPEGIRAAMRLLLETRAAGVGTR